MNINIRNVTLDGRFDWLFYAIFDLNDALGGPFHFVLGDGITWKNWRLDENEVEAWDHSSARYALAAWLIERIKIQRDQEAGRKGKP